MKYCTAVFDSALLYRGGYFHVQICEISLLSKHCNDIIFHSSHSTHVPTLFLFPFFLFDFWNYNILLGY